MYIAGPTLLLIKAAYMVKSSKSPTSINPSTNLTGGVTTVTVQRMWVAKLRFSLEDSGGYLAQEYTRCFFAVLVSSDLPY